MDLLEEAGGINVGLAKVKISLKEGNRTILEACFEDKVVDISTQES